MTDLTISHTPEEGTLIEGTTKGDGAADVLKAHGWRWGRSIAAWFIPRSRDTAPKRHVIDPSARALEDAGFTVELDLDERRRSTADVEADKIARQEQRAEAMAEKAQRLQGRADTAHVRAERDGDRLPPGGEPIKVGHHSEHRHRRALDQAHTSMGRSVEAQKEADRAASRAASAASTTRARYSVRTVANRLERISADIRKVERYLEGYTAEQGSPYARQIPPATGGRRERLSEELAHLTDALTYWQGVRDEQIEQGVATNYQPEDITKGDLVRVDREWRQVVRVNRKTVSVATGYSWTDPVRYTEIEDHRAVTT